MKVGDGSSCLFWTDSWNNETLASSYPELSSFAKNKRITLAGVKSHDNFQNLFHLPLSIQAFEQFQELEGKLVELDLTQNRDEWWYSWGS